jgi:hypothetical protein
MEFKKQSTDPIPSFRLWWSQVTFYIALQKCIVLQVLVNYKKDIIFLRVSSSFVHVLQENFKMWILVVGISWMLCNST